MPASQFFQPTNFSIDNISLGPCLVYFKGPDDLTYRHCGHTFGGVDVAVTQQAIELKSDQYGDAALKSIDAGIKLEVIANLTEATFDNLKMLFCSATDVNSGDADEYLTFGKPIGGEIVTGELVLEPTDGSSMFRVYRAAANVGNAISIMFDATKQRVFACKFIGLIDNTRQNGDQLFRIGGVYALNSSLTLEAITPSHGTKNGGTSVTVNFDPAWCIDLTSLTITGITAKFGAAGTPVVASSVTAKSATFTTPAHAVGAVDVIISAVDGDDTYSLTLTSGFTFDAS